MTPTLVAAFVIALFAPLRHVGDGCVLAANVLLAVGLYELGRDAQRGRWLRAAAAISAIWVAWQLGERFVLARSVEAFEACRLAMAALWIARAIALVIGLDGRRAPIAAAVALVGSALLSAQVLPPVFDYMHAHGPLDQLYRPAALVLWVGGGLGLLARSGIAPPVQDPERLARRLRRAAAALWLRAIGITALLVAVRCFPVTSDMIELAVRDAPLLFQLLGLVAAAMLLVVGEQNAVIGAALVAASVGIRHTYAPYAELAGLALIATAIPAASRILLVTFLVLGGAALAFGGPYYTVTGVGALIAYARLLQRAAFVAAQTPAAPRATLRPPPV